MARRRYDRTLRKAQALETRGRILDAVIASLANQKELSLPELASAAGVSVPTIYRYFPTREALMDATQEAIGARLGRPSWPDVPEDLGTRVQERFSWFEANDVLIRAILSSPLGREILASVQRRREHAITRALASRITHLDKTHAWAVLAITSMLDDAHTWRQLRDAWRLSAEDAAWVARWATNTLLAQLDREQAETLRRKRNTRRVRA